jgi:hypothetical protein
MLAARRGCGEDIETMFKPACPGTAGRGRQATGSQATVHAEPASPTEDAWTLESPGPILNPRARAVELLEVPYQCRQCQQAEPGCDEPERVRAQTGYTAQVTDEP